MTQVMDKLSNPQKTIEIIQKYNFNFQKKFGQNFLIDSHVLNKIIAGAGVTKDDFVLEIGPGIGTLTQYLCEAAGKVFAVEIDKNLLPILEETLAPYDNITVINEDILKLDFFTDTELKSMIQYLSENNMTEVMAYVMEYAKDGNFRTDFSL